MDIDIQWGGYYATREEGKEQYSLFRLLDFNSSSYHIAIFQEKFTDPPTLEQVADLAPFIGHAPLDSRSLLHLQEARLLGGVPLDDDSLYGFRVFLAEMGAEDENISELFASLIAFSHEAPLPLTLALVDDTLDIRERR